MIKKHLIARDGNKCNVCGSNSEGVKLIVDHKDNNYLNNDKNNLQLCCQSCNIKKNPPYRNKKDVDNFSLSPPEPDMDDQYLSAEPYVSLENYPVWKNLKSEPVFKNWLKTEMTKKLEMNVIQVINDGANIANCSSRTTTTYLDKLVYETGPYIIKIDKDTAHRILKWKPKCFPFKEEI